MLYYRVLFLNLFTVYPALLKFTLKNFSLKNFYFCRPNFGEDKDNSKTKQPPNMSESHPAVKLFIGEG